MAKNRSKQSVRNRASRRARAAKPARSPGRSSLSSLPLEAITAELRRRQSEIPTLEARARALRGELAAVEARIATLSGLANAARPAVAARSAPAKGMKAAKTAKVTKTAKAGTAAGRGLRKRRNGQPTLSERIVTLLSDGAAPRSPREIAAALAPALGRPVNQSFLVQISLTLRKLVNAGEITQPARAQYGAAPAAKGGAADAAS